MDLDDAVADVIAVLEELGLDEIPTGDDGNALKGDALIHVFLHAANDEQVRRDDFRETLAALADMRISRGDLRRRRRAMRSYKTAIASYPCLSEHMGPQGLYVQIQCTKCGKTDSRRLKQKDISPEHVLLPGFRKSGWEIKKKGKEALCSACATSRAPKQPMTASVLEQQAVKENERRKKEAEDKAAKDKQPQLAVVPEPPVQTIEAPKMPTYETKFKRRIVEEYEEVPEGEHMNFLRKNKVTSARHAAWKRAYLEGRLGKICVVVSLRAPSKPFRCVDRRNFSESFKRQVVEEASELSGQARNDYFKCRALTESLFSRWKDKFVGPTQSKPVSNPKTQFQLFQLLQEHFDKDLHRYKEGWSDDRCAKELNLDAKYVAQVRAEVLGPVRNPEVEAIHQELEDVKRRMGRDLNELKELWSTFKEDYERQIEALSDRLTAAERST